MSRRTILHADMNNCYASIEMLHHPKLRAHPVAVGGNAELRHGIILARNYEARSYDIKVGQTLWEARLKCPNLIIVPPDYDKYLRFSRLFKAILSKYSPQVESFGLDESWLDVTGFSKYDGDGRMIADEIRERIKFELGVTVSIGVSFNKIFSKLGSDLKKPDATTVITEKNFRDMIWPLPSGDLLGVGRKMRVKLASLGIMTIGDIANTNPGYLHSWFGKWGLTLHSYANGLEASPVVESGFEHVVKSVGNSSTCPRDLENDEDAHIVFQNLSESVAERMREQGFMAKTVQISLRTNDLFWFERQMHLPQPTHISTELCAAAMNLLRQNWKWQKPLRTIGVRGVDLIPAGSPRQISLFYDELQREKAEKIEFAIDDIRGRYGHHMINRAMLLLDQKLGKLDPKADHISPVA